MTISPRLQVFQPDHTVRISGFQNLRALQSEVLPVAKGIEEHRLRIIQTARYGITHFRLARRNEV
jgi:hypothetical protein